MEDKTSSPVFSLIGTVFNNANRVRGSIESMAAAMKGLNYEIVVVDNYSSDGTYEKIRELSKEYPIRIFRAKCSRGKGRKIAFENAKGEYIVYVDFDSIYNIRMFRLAINTYLKWNQRGQKSLVGFGSQVHPRKILEILGSWKDLNCSEDMDLLARLYAKDLAACLPIKDVRQNEKVEGLREKRYAKGFKLIFRLLNCRTDQWIGDGLTIGKFIKFKNFYDKNGNKHSKNRISSKFSSILFGTIIFLLAKIKAKVKNVQPFYADKNLTNNHFVHYMCLKTAINPLDFGYENTDISPTISNDLKTKYVCQTYKNVIEYVQRINSWRRAL